MNAAPYSMMVLAFDWMLDDVVRFYTVPGNCSVLSVDPTFSLGSFDVTVTTYGHLLLTMKDRKLKHPTMIGPLFIHVRKDFSAYHFFASSLVSQRHELHQLQCFGSDGEAALVKAFSTVFSKASHLGCFLHFRENVERKLRELNIPKETAKEFVRDVFGCVASRQRGLVDAKISVELEDMFSSVQQIWNDRERKSSSTPVFHRWFGTYCLDVVKDSMLASVREQAGLGSPPEPFYTNAIESKNNILKQHLNRKSSSLPKFVEQMKTLLQQQYKEIQMAVPSEEEYRIACNYLHLACDSQKWFKMSPKQRQAKISKFMQYPLQPVPCTVEQQGDSSLSELGLPPHTASTIWSRAQLLAENESSNVAAPGDETAFLVKSSSGQRPHYVKSTKKGGFACDDQCLGYKSLRICSHTVASAIKKGDINSYLRWYKGLKVKPSFSNLSEHRQPSGTGKKPCKGVSK